MKLNQQNFKNITKTLPKNPGVYQYYDKNDKILYVGKAKNLKNRISSYFNRDSLMTYKTKLLVKKIEKLEFIIVKTELDALLLENNLIKKLKPKYNILLKDDKTYPWICIKKERFPRILYTRKVINDGSEYFGPYNSLKSVKLIIELIEKLYKLRTCNYDLNEENIIKKKYKVCLDYHIGKCGGPCEKHQSEKDYDNSISNIRKILKGNFSEIIKSTKKKMLSYASNLNFEKAQDLKEKIEILQNYQSKSTIVSPKIKNLDVFSILSDDDYAYINYFNINNGSIIQSYNLEVKKKLQEKDQEILIIGIIEIRLKFKSKNDEIITNIEVSFPSKEKLKIYVPKIGEKKDLINLSQRNAKYMRMERINKSTQTDKNKKFERVLEKLKKDLNLDKTPLHIECFDNSNLQGSNPTSSCVVFKNGKPSKKDYRHYKINTVVGIDDFASMKEVVNRRYKYLIKEKLDLPQLVVIDGGKGQLNAAFEALINLEIQDKISIISIAKRLEEIFTIDNPYPINIDKRSESLKLIQSLRNEAHRFCLRLHRNIRNKNLKKSEFDNIKGIGEKTREKLLKKYKSIKRIKKLDFIELEKLIGRAKALIVFKFFK